MQLQEQTASGILLITRIEGDTVWAGPTAIKKSCWINAEAISDWPAQIPVGCHDLHPLLEYEPSIIIIGTNEKHSRVVMADALVLAASQGAGLEKMGLRAACHTYNMLALEGRRSALGIIIQNAA